MRRCLEGKSVAVTGAGRGIGRAVAVACAEAGAGVVVNQPVETRAMFKDGRWTPEEIAARLPGAVGVERMALIDRLEQMRQAAAKGGKANAA